jgi:hypothetical protein
MVKVRFFILILRFWRIGTTLIDHTIAVIISAIACYFHRFIKRPVVAYNGTINAICNRTCTYPHVQWALLRWNVLINHAIAVIVESIAGYFNRLIMRAKIANYRTVNAVCNRSRANSILRAILRRRIFIDYHIAIVIDIVTPVFRPGVRFGIIGSAITEMGTWPGRVAASISLQAYRIKPHIESRNPAVAVVVYIDPNAVAFAPITVNAIIIYPSKFALGYNTGAAQAGREHNVCWWRIHAVNGGALVYLSVAVIVDAIA